ncbi:MAG TPA: hypothetical protein VMW50_03720, partial [Dehalococcoidia bacterium]|nr:hypothetical protein [Dehalococcoidia bacterium]
MNRRIYRSDELDTTDEVVKEMQILRNQVLENFQGIEENRSKIDDSMSKPKPVDRPKKAKKGSVLMKTLVGIAIAVMIAIPCFAADITFEQATTTESLVKWLNSNV